VHRIAYDKEIDGLLITAEGPLSAEEFVQIIDETIIFDPSRENTRPIPKHSVRWKRLGHGLLALKTFRKPRLNLLLRYRKHLRSKIFTLSNKKLLT